MTSKETERETHTDTEGYICKNSRHREKKIDLQTRWEKRRGIQRDPDRRGGCETDQLTVICWNREPLRHNENKREMFSNVQSCITLN